MDVIATFLKCEALLEGHFILSSGLHSNRYLQCAKILQYPKIAEELGAEIAKKFSDMQIDTVVGPAMGGVIIAQEVARALGCRSIFSERENGAMTLRPNDAVLKNANKADTIAKAYGT